MGLGLQLEAWAQGEEFALREQSLTLPQLAFSYLWDSIHGPGAFTRGDWVWVIGFKRIE